MRTGTATPLTPISNYIRIGQEGSSEIKYADEEALLPHYVKYMVQPDCFR
jgi:hypothetical protein